jgi:hypothetical protein
LFRLHQSLLSRASSSAACNKLRRAAKGVIDAIVRGEVLAARTREVNNIGPLAMA